MKKLRVIFLFVALLMFMNCFSSKPIQKSKLFGEGVKYWNRFSGNPDHYEDGWIFRKDLSFSYYKKTDKTNVEIMEWIDDDIKIGKKGIVPWKLSNDTLEVTHSNFKIFKLNNDTLKVIGPITDKVSSKDTIVFINCKKCTSWSNK